MTIAHAIDLILSLKQDNAVKSIYIKDWHLIKQLHSEVEPYTVPDIFADDWMNNIYGEKDDFRFVYAGTRGSSTLLHRDVYTSYSWSTNVVGCKTWYLFPPRAIACLRRFTRVETSELIPSLEALHTLVKDKNRKEFPQLELALGSMQTITQAQGETIFVPSNWYHQVHNDTDCASINRNWCNSVNLPSMYRAIVVELDHAEEALCDVRDMLQQSSRKGKEEWKKEFYGLVQDVAVKDAGWAWKGFWEMVLHNLKHPATAQALRPDGAANVSCNKDQ
uniref:JmjC domain-containing protein n=1 Tax=Kalmanozyma brasiliensis (strain GHG001) TaxID=1365824 RepID=V5EWL0_KALBG